MDNTLRYAGKRVIVTGAASGIGAATAALLVELGAEVHAVDFKRPDIAALASFTECDLGDPEQIHATVAKIGSVVNALFNCAGLPNTSPDISVMLVNFCGLREITEAVVPYMLDGSAIASIASTAGIGWPTNMHTLSGLLATPDFETARRGARPGPTISPTPTGFPRKRSTPTPRCGRSRSRPRASVSTA